MFVADLDGERTGIADGIRLIHNDGEPHQRVILSVSFSDGLGGLLDGIAPLFIALVVLNNHDVVVFRIGHLHDEFDFRHPGILVVVSVSLGGLGGILEGGDIGVISSEGKGSYFSFPTSDSYKEFRRKGYKLW